MPKPNQLPKLNFQVDPVFQQWLNQATDTINVLAGYNGPIQLSDHIDMGGKRVMNVGAPASPSDAIASGVAEGKYSAPVLRPQLESGGKFSFRGYRQINNATQREETSSFLTNLMSTPPSASTVFPTIVNSGSQVQVSIPASVFTFSDGSTVRIQGRVDLLSRPSQYAISSLSVAGGIVTCDCAPSGLIAGEVATIVPGSNQSFAGTFQLTSSTGGGTVLQMQNPNATGTDSSGFVQENGVWYYAIQKKTQSLILSGPYSADTLQNRLQVSYDGSQIVAVVTVTNSGAQIASSGGGGTPLTGPPASGGFF